jgi:uncharacterized protein
VLVFARAAVPGRVKTRLVPRLGEWRAARLHARLTRHALCIAQAAACGPVELFDTSKQRGADLGERMHRALAGALRRHRGAIVIGADCPALRPRDLRRAARWLAGGCDVVLAPAEDGGYALIAAKRVSPLLFSGIAWGGDDVYEATVRKLISLGYRWQALGRVWDVDRPEDLERLNWPRLALHVGALRGSASSATKAAPRGASLTRSAR